MMGVVPMQKDENSLLRLRLSQSQRRLEAPTREPQAFRVGSDVVVATPVDAEGRTLSAVRIYRRDAQGALIERIDAAWADVEALLPEGWRAPKPYIRIVKQPA